MIELIKDEDNVTVSLSFTLSRINKMQGPYCRYQKIKELAIDGKSRDRRKQFGKIREFTWKLFQREEN